MSTCVYTLRACTFFVGARVFCLAVVGCFFARKEYVAGSSRRVRTALSQPKDQHQVAFRHFPHVLLIRSTTQCWGRDRATDPGAALPPAVLFLLVPVATSRHNSERGKTPPRSAGFSPPGGPSPQVHACNKTWQKNPATKKRSFPIPQKKKETQLFVDLR